MVYEKKRLKEFNSIKGEGEEGKKGSKRKAKRWNGWASGSFLDQASNEKDSC